LSKRRDLVDPALLFAPEFVASDLDGTLLPPTLEFLPETIEGVSRLRRAGVPFVISTGRMFKSARRMAARLGLVEGPIVCYQGALVADLATGAWLRHLPMPADRAVEVVLAMRRLSRHVNVYVDDELYVEQDDVWARRYAEYAEVGMNVVADLVPVAERRPTKIVIASEPDDITTLLPRLQALWNGQLYVTRSLPHFIEVNDLRATKSAALDFLLPRFSALREHTVACGDGLNDVDMLEWAGLGVAVAEAADGVRDAADAVVPRQRLGELFTLLASRVGARPRQA
jgi:Cof subfamily protein (haloacid dehalogenase superfamily)